MLKTYFKDSNSRSGLSHGECIDVMAKLALLELGVYLLAHTLQKVCIDE